MKRAVIGSVLAAALLLCACDKKDSSQTESQIVSGTTTTTATTKATSLTIASQHTTQKTDFTSKDMNHTEQEERQEIEDFCRFIADKWVSEYNGGPHFDFTPYCKYEDLAKYLEYTAGRSDRSQKLDEITKTNFMIGSLQYDENRGTVNITTLNTKGYDYLQYGFVLQSVDGKFKLCDMLIDHEDSPDISVRADQFIKPDPEYWAKQGRYGEVIKAISEEKLAYSVKETDKLTDADMDTIRQFGIFIADRWAEYVGVSWNRAWFKYCRHNDMKEYFKMSRWEFAVDGGRYFEPDKSELTIESVKLSGTAAVIRGTYPNYLKEPVSLVIIAENVGGKLMLNDLINDVEYSDRTFRPEMVKDPKPDYWKDASHLTAIKKKYEEMKE